MKKQKVDSSLQKPSNEQSNKSTEISPKEEAILQKLASILVDLVIEEQRQKTLQSQKQ